MFGCSSPAASKGAAAPPRNSAWSFCSSQNHTYQRRPQRDKIIRQGVNIRQSAILSFIALFIATALYTQQDMSAITGVVTDGSGANVPGAHVTVRDIATNEVRVVDTVGPLRIGTYEIAIEKSGFRLAVWTDIQVHSQDRVRADLQLEVGQVSDTVTVTSAVPARASSMAVRGPSAPTGAASTTSRSIAARLASRLRRGRRYS
jgi:hypothetical protein